MSSKVIGETIYVTETFNLTPTFDLLNIPYLSMIETSSDGDEILGTLRCTYSYPDGSSSTSKIVGGDSLTNKQTFNLSKDEYVNKVGVNVGNWEERVYRIKFNTNKGRSF